MYDMSSQEPSLCFPIIHPIPPGPPLELTRL